MDHESIVKCINANVERTMLNTNVDCHFARRLILLDIQPKDVKNIGASNQLITLMTKAKAMRGQINTDISKVSLKKVRDQFPLK